MWMFGQSHFYVDFQNNVHYLLAGTGKCKGLLLSVGSNVSFTHKNDSFVGNCKLDDVCL